MKNLYLAIEGRNGSGKTKLCDSLAPWLNERYERLLRVAEPAILAAAGTAISQFLKAKSDSYRFSDHTAALLYAANRSDLLDRWIIPFLKEGSNGVVLSDRCFLSSLVYQNGRAMGYPAVMEINRFILPHLILVLDVTDEHAEIRMKTRGSARQDKYESVIDEESPRYRMAARYVSSNTNCTLHVINANRSLTEVLEDAQAVICAYAHLEDGRKTKGSKRAQVAAKTDPSTDVR